MNRKHLIIVLVVLLIGVLVGILKWPHTQVEPRAITQATKSEAPASRPKVQATQADTPPQGIVIPDVPGRKLSDQDKVNIARIVQVFSASIDFWGKVIDQHGDPIAGAAVHYSAADKYFKDGTKYEGTSDANGLFSISNIKGAGLFVNVAKQGYYGSKKSGGSFGYGMPSGESPPSKQQPAVFVLQKMGETEPLLNAKGSVRLPRDGTPTEITLRRPRPAVSSSGKADLRIEVWTDDAHQDEQRKYDWRCRVSVPGGGLLERVGAFNFEAPVDGYVSTFEQDMPRTNPRWTNGLQKEFFLKLADGSFARVSFQLAAGGDHFVYLESYLNPTPGSRNLEFDPAKAIKP